MRETVRRLAMGGLIAASTGVGTAGGAERDPLAAYRWASRVLVISAPSKGDPGLKAQRDAFSAEGGGVAERDLVVVEAIGREPEAAALRRRFRLAEDRFTVVLVGKDGTTKLSSEAPIPLRLVFATIDAMPMRRDETRSRPRSP